MGVQCAGDYILTICIVGQPYWGVGSPLLIHMRPCAMFCLIVLTVCYLLAFLFRVVLNSLELSGLASINLFSY
jgi:hypothetical protein